jgi:CXXC-20-CXXC protein
MRFCEECNSKFSFLDRLKSIPKEYGDMKCANCNTIYRQKRNIYKGIFNGLVVFICLQNQDLIKFTDNIFIKGIIMVVLVVVITLVFDLIPHRWQKYEKYE